VPKGRHRRIRQSRLPSIFVDEHLFPAIAESFREIGFRVIEINRTSRFKGHDERSYLPALRRVNAIFVTSDEDYVRWLELNSVQHPGVLFLPKDLPSEDKVWMASVAGYYFRGACRTSRFSLRNQVFFGAYDGLNTRYRGKDLMVFSWDWLLDASNETPPERRSRS
jgi:hypothetical protein